MARHQPSARPPRLVDETLVVPFCVIVHYVFGYRCAQVSLTERYEAVETTLPTATFRVLFVFIVLRHDRRRIVHFNVTEHPSAEWTAQQMVDAFPWDTAPRYLVRDRDQTYGAYFDTRVDGLGMEQVLTAPRSPWQNPFVERMIGSIRRECLDHVIVLDEQHLRRILRKYVDYYQSCRTHLSLEKDAPEPRLVESPAMGKVRAIPKVGGLHHYYTRRAA